MISVKSNNYQIGSYLIALIVGSMARRIDSTMVGLAASQRVAPNASCTSIRSRCSLNELI
jgi:hypothetical protein